jgi:hypothetical protein
MKLLALCGSQRTQSMSGGLLRACRLLIRSWRNRRPACVLAALRSRHRSDAAGRCATPGGAALSYAAPPDNSVKTAAYSAILA